MVLIRPPSAAVLAFLLGILVVGSVRGEPSPAEQARAEVLFDEGKRLLAQRRYEDACPKLEESLKIEEAGGTLAALALCHQEQGRTATAWAEFKALLALAHKTNHEARRALAEQSLRELEPRLIWLLVEVTPETAALSGVEVLLDGKALGSASWGLSLPVDPGTHRLEARAAGFVAWSTSFSVGPEPERRSIKVPLLSRASPPVSPGAAFSAAPSAAPSPGNEAPPRGRTLSWVVGGVGAASLLVGGSFGVSALLLQRKADEACPERGCPDDAAITQSRDAARHARIANVGVGVGLVGLVAAYLLWPPSRERTADSRRLQLGGTAEPRGAGFTLRGAFLPVETPALAPGELLDGKYEIRRVLGRGAMGCVYEATHVLLGDLVAIKCLHSDTPSEAAIARFLREARVVRAIRSPHAVKVLEVGLLPNQNPFIVMELLRGSNLEGHLQACGALPLERVADLLIQACDGLAEAHRAGVVHRDLKPENLFLAQGPDGTASLKVLDFGVAKMLVQGTSPREFLQTAGPIGTPLFMSPEQIQGGSLDARSDLWAIGVLLFYLLTERFPFESPTIEGLAVQICTAPPLRLADLRRDLPAPVLALVDDCLQKQAEKRPASVFRIAQGLQPFAPPAAALLVERIGRILGDSEEPAPRGATPSLPEEPPLSLARTLPESTSLSGEPGPADVPDALPPRKPDGRRWGLLLLLLLLPVLGLVWWWRPTPPPAAASVAASSAPIAPEPPAEPATQPSPPTAPSAPGVLVISAPLTQPAAPPVVKKNVNRKSSPPETPAHIPAATPPPPSLNPKQSAIEDRK